MTRIVRAVYLRSLRDRRAVRGVVHNRLPARGRHREDDTRRLDSEIERLRDTLGYTAQGKIRDVIERLIDLDYLKRLSADYPILTLTDEFDAFFHDKRTAVMKMRAEKKKTTVGRRNVPPRVPEGAGSELYEKLRRLASGRGGKARDTGVQHNDRLDDAPCRGGKARGHKGALDDTRNELRGREALRT